jgi:hypothetical protein
MKVQAIGYEVPIKRWTYPAPRLDESTLWTLEAYFKYKSLLTQSRLNESKSSIKFLNSPIQDPIPIKGWYEFCFKKIQC